VRDLRASARPRAPRSLRTTAMRRHSARNAAACVWRSERPLVVSRDDQKHRADGDRNAGLEAAWKHQPEADRRKPTSVAARIACIRPKPHSTEADGSRLLAYGMQEVVGSSPTSSTGNGLQSGRFEARHTGRRSGHDARLEALTSTRRLSCPPRDRSRPDRRVPHGSRHRLVQASE
jgi:hypothetical protein